MPTVREFSDEFLETYAAVNNKPSEQASKRCIIKHHINPLLGNLPLDGVARGIEPFKAQLKKVGLSPKRINNILACLSKLLRYAQEREILPVAPRVRLLKLPPQKFAFFDFGEYPQLLEAAKQESEWYAMVVTAGDAGLRMGELLALEWGDLDFQIGSLTVRRSNWQGHIGSPKGGKERTIPLTQQLLAALKAHRHLRGPLVFCGAAGGSADTQPPQEADPEVLPPGRASRGRLACAEAHLLQPSGHAGGGAQGNPGAGRPHVSGSDHEVHAPDPDRITGYGAASG